MCLPRGDRTALHAWLAGAGSLGSPAAVDVVDLIVLVEGDGLHAVGEGPVQHADACRTGTQRRDPGGSQQAVQTAQTRSLAGSRQGHSLSQPDRTGAAGHPNCCAGAGGQGRLCHKTSDSSALSLQQHKPLIIRVLHHSTGWQRTLRMESRHASQLSLFINSATAHPSQPSLPRHTWLFRAAAERSSQGRAGSPCPGCPRPGSAALLDMGRGVPREYPAGRVPGWAAEPPWGVLPAPCGTPGAPVPRHSRGTWHHLPRTQRITSQALTRRQRPLLCVPPGTELSPPSVTQLRQTLVPPLTEQGTGSG